MGDAIAADDLIEDAVPLPPADGMGLFADAPAEPGPARTNFVPDTYRVLARKYRPATLDDLIGQDATVRILRRAFAVGRVAHAFMLTGVRGVGKTTTARIIARALCCIGPDGTGGPTADPCGACVNCTSILEGRHPDVLEMDAASRTGVDDVREIIEQTRFRPMLARAKVFIIDEVHMLSKNAFNALLKTLEEPPPSVTFIFATTELRKVPVTVLSRCQRFDLRRVGHAVLAAHFRSVAAAEKVAIADEAVEAIARAADGSVRDGLSLLDQAIAYAAAGDGSIDASVVSEMLGLADRTVLFDLLDAIMAGRPADALRLLERAYADGADPGQMLVDLLELLHVLTRLKSIPELAAGSELPELERTRGAALAARLGIAWFARAWQILLKGITELDVAPSRRAAAEMTLIRLCYVADLPAPADLVRRLSSPGGAPGGGNAARGPGGSAPGGGAPGGGGTAVARAIPLEAPGSEPEPVPARALPTSWREVVALVAVGGRQPMLHAHLRNGVRPVRVGRGVIEIRQLERTPRDLAARLAGVLLERTGIRWTVALSNADGEPTLDEQGRAVADAALADVSAHPLVREILRVFPGATIGEVTDSGLDAYGLPADPAEAPVLGGEADGPPPDPDDMFGDGWEIER